MSVSAKICGLKTPADVVAAVEGGALFVGFVFFRRSPRFLPLADARDFARLTPPSVRRVGLVVDASDDELRQVLAESKVDVLQLHGQETPGRVADIRNRFGVPVIKAIGVGDAEDLERACVYDAVADWLMFDARPPSNATRPGGNAAVFDWSLLRGRSWSKPWLLAGGLTAKNVGEAVASSGASVVDVSSGVESAKGVKSPSMILAFLAEAARAESE